MISITKNTKISELIKANAKSIDAIAALAKPLEKLKNPILRKIMASRVTIAEAAKMGGCTVSDFEKALAPLGFVFSGSEVNTESIQEANPHWITDAPGDDIDYYDVRPIIDNGSDPLKEILHRFKQVPDGKILCLINTFVPTPLIHLLEKEKAEASFVETINSKEYHTYFLKKSKPLGHFAQTVDDRLYMDDDAGFDKVCAQFSGERRREIDVRELEMPGPMEAILSELKTLPADNGLYIHHKRVPVYLLEELADKNYEVHILSKGEGNVKMLIFSKANG